MILSYQNHSWLLSTSPYVFLILLLQLLHSRGVDGTARFTIVNRCTQPIWPVVQNRGTLEIAEYELPIGSSIAFQRPNGWFGRVWGRTGCIFNEAGKASCATGDCGPQNQCNSTNTNPYAITMAEFQLGSNGSSIPMNFYDVSLVDGYNLPLLLKPSSAGSSASCRSTGCTQDSLSQMCPPELRTAGGAGCQGPCAVFGSPEYCCTGGQPSCGPTNYSQLFKKACPLAFSYPLDDVNTTFTCGTAADYSITFCPPYDSLLGMPPAPAATPAYPPQSFYNNPQERKGSDAGKNRAKQKITIVSISISGVIIASIILCVYLKRRHSHKWKCNQDMENLLLQHGSLAPKRYRYSEIKKITKSLREKLGRGGYGSVYKGILPDGRLVAVKILIETESNGEEFINEVISISRTYHVNIVTLLGFCYEGNKRALVYEFMPNKSLDKFLNNSASAESGDPFLDLSKLFKIAVGIAKGLEYLHTGCITRIVHFDIKPQNILLDQDLCPKISDFGLAKLCKKKHSILSVLGTRGTIGYIAPEVFSRNFGGVSHKSDVYSYGMMLLEMAGARKIVETEVTQSNENYFPDEIYEQVIIDAANNVHDLKIQGEEETRRKMYMVGFWCIQTIPSDRPSISKVVEMLEGNIQSIQIPPKPFLFPPVIPANQETSPSLSAPVEIENLAQN